ncbi:HTH-type transcriptional regulator DmlR [Marinomonas aquimarina]|uniref:HTH-type transcriptional regulator DmlR n=1 Tax=Marinomonas aquimarina TaxID=295068 RepID=A0A1A8TB51_9GAMM|nr:LysR family transcriptional regulator [Marinomonas aquimarina]SBS29020.1 HTH-type transcriptional regulator DmlR [Marinomonas aquimarina]
MQIEDLAVVMKVAELGSITAAATHLDMQPATASAALKRVEALLGAELFIRSTRQLRVSKAGERFLPLCAQSLEQWQLAQQAVQQDSESIAGEMRIAVSSDLGRNILAPLLDTFMTQHPDLTLRMHLSDSNIDFYRDAIDMALRYGAPNDSSMYGFKICNVPRLLCASPDYLANHAKIEHPNDLLQHNALFYQLRDILNDVWFFQDEQQRQYKIKPTANRAANDGDMVRRWCLAGQGVALKSALDVAEDVLAGRLRSLLPDYTVPCGELWLICPSRHSITPSMRLLRDELREHTQQKLERLRAAGVLSKKQVNRLEQDEKSPR